MINHKLLARKTNVSEFGLVTKKQFIELAKANGWEPRAQELDGYEFGSYKRRVFNRLGGDEQLAYETRLKKKKVRYFLYLPDGRTHYAISKTEFDYFKSLN